MIPISIPRNELLKISAQNYITERYRSVVFLREESQSYIHARGYLAGVCTAFSVDYKEVCLDKELIEIQFYHQKSGRLFLKVSTIHHSEYTRSKIGE